MSLILSSSIKELDASLRQIDNDGATSPVELQAIRDRADRHVSGVTGLPADAKAGTGTDSPLGNGMIQLLSYADGLVEALQRVSLEARKTKLPQDRRDELKAAVEHQIAYVVAGYQSSVQRL